MSDGRKKKYIELFGSFPEPFICVNNEYCYLFAARNVRDTTYSKRSSGSYW